MYPYVDLPFELPIVGEVRLPVYGMLFATGVLVAWWWFARRARALEVREDLVFNLTFYTLLAGLVGAKLLLIGVDLYRGQPIDLLGVLRSAGVVIGGLIGGAAAFVAYGRRHDLPVLSLADAIAAPVALSQAIGRLGCLFAGCCYGKLTDAWWGIRFPNPEAVGWLPPVGGVYPARIPTQLIHAGFDLGLALVLTLMWRRRPAVPGTIFWCYMLLYAIGRAAIEFLRGDTERGLFLGGAVSTSQVLSLAAAALAVFLLWRRPGRPSAR